LDIDKNSLRQRIKFVNSQLKQLKRLLAQQYHIVEAGQFISLTVPTDDEDDEEIIIELACYFMNVEGIGELETVLKAIKESNDIKCIKKIAIHKFRGWAHSHFPS